MDEEAKKKVEVVLILISSRTRLVWNRLQAMCVEFTMGVMCGREKNNNFPWDYEQGIDSGVSIWKLKRTIWITCVSGAFTNIFFSSFYSLVFHFSLRMFFFIHPSILFTVLLPLSLPFSGYYTFPTIGAEQLYESRAFPNYRQTLPCPSQLFRATSQ